MHFYYTKNRLLSDKIEDFNDYWQHVGGSLYDLFHFDDDVAREHRLYTPENTPGIINRFSPIQGAPDAAYYRWGSSGMPTSVPISAITSMGTERMFEFVADLEPQQTDRYDVPTRPAGIPSNVPSEQIAPVVNVYINDEEAKAEAVTVSNGLYGR